MIRVKRRLNSIDVVDARGVVAEWRPEERVALSRSDSGDADGLGGAERVEAIDQGDPDVDFSSLAIGIPRGDALTEGLPASYPLAGRALRSNVPRGHQKLQRPFGTAKGDLHLEGLLSAAQRRIVRNGPVQPRQAQEARDHPGCLPERQPEQNLDPFRDLVAQGPVGQWTGRPGSRYSKRPAGAPYAARARPSPCPARSAATRAS